MLQDIIVIEMFTSFVEHFNHFWPETFDQVYQLKTDKFIASRISLCF